MSQAVETELVRQEGVKAHRGVLVLTMGIIGLFGLVPAAIAAWVLGQHDLDAMRTGRVDRSGEKLSNAGYVLGITGTFLFVLEVIGFFLWLALFATAPADEVVKWHVPRPPKDRMLAAMLVNGEDMWFLKLDGPENKVVKHVEEFKGLLRSLNFDKKGQLTWDLPAEWKREAGSDFRFATLRVSPILGVSVTKLPKSAELANVNRWRQQLGLSRLKKAELPQHVEKIPAAAKGVEVLLVDITGDKGQAIPPRAAAPAEVTYKAPEGWKQVPTQFNFQKAAFVVPDGDKEARVTISVAAGSPLDNVNRWRQQLGLPEVNGEDLIKLLTKIDIAGEESFMVDMTGTKRDAKFNRIIVAMHPVAGQMYFFRLEGLDDVVERQKPRFDEFLRSVEFE